ncbi:MAG: TIR domain-containing protein [Clostridiales bacterium]|nr:TIR domain-containing protein [Clostridiales bacterium]
MSVFKCKMCGGTIEFEQGATVGVCDHCGTKQSLPAGLDDEKRANLYDRANHFRRNNEYDKAMGIYETILADDKTDAEAYWSLVLCRYGIEYVEDPATHKRIPTVNRAQFTSIFDDDNYKSAIQYADVYQRTIYEEEAKTINDIQKGILAISQKEEPFDVFICYKETDNNGRRTPDSVLANDLYHQLTQEGFKVFFSRITLEDKLGTAYEPYIFAALNSAKVMVVLGTKPEHFNAVWVKNEWSRYLALVKESGGKKVLIPAYRDMDPYDLPEEFSHLQAQDMSKLGFMQDLLHGIKKILGPEAKPVQEKVVVHASAPTNANVVALKKRGFMALEDGEWDKADSFFEEALNQDAEDAECYLGKLMAELNIKKRDDLKNAAEPFDDRNNCVKASRFDEKLAKEIAETNSYIRERNENARLNGIYNDAVKAMNAANSESVFMAAAAKFKTIPGFKDADALAEQCLEKAEVCRKDAIYASARSQMIGNLEINYISAIETFQTIPGWKDSDEQISVCQRKIEEIKAKEEADRLERERKEEERRIAAEIAAKKRKKIIAITTPIVAVLTVFLIVLNSVIIPKIKYNAAVDLYNSGEYDEALSAFTKLNGYKDSANKVLECKYNLAVALNEKSNYKEAFVTFGALGDYKDAKEMAHKTALKYQKSISGLVSAGDDHTVGLKADGTVVAVGDNDDGQCDVENWKDIVAISAGDEHTVGLKSDGTVVAVGKNDDGQCNVNNWKDIVAVSAGTYHTVGLKSDGTVVATKYIGDYYKGQCEVDNCKDIVAISTGWSHTVGLKADGTVVAVGRNSSGQCNVNNWKDIVAISAGTYHTVGLKSDGTVVAVGKNDDGQCNVNNWKDIVAVSAGTYHTVGLKADGTVVAVGYNDDGKCNVGDWKDIVTISAGEYHTVGLKSDGTVVAVGYNDYGQCNVNNWKDIMLPKTVTE